MIEILSIVRLVFLLPLYNSEFRMIVSLSGGRAGLASVEPGVGQGQVCKKGKRGLISEIYLFVRIVVSPKRESHQ